MHLRSTLHAADVSVYGGGVTQPQSEKLASAGVELLIVGLWHGYRINQYAADTLRHAQSAGMRTAGYTVITPGRDNYAVSQALAAASGEPLEFLALDCELAGVTIGDIDMAVQLAHKAGCIPVIYTGAWFWRDRLGNPDNAWGGSVPLWDADYSKNPSDCLAVDYGEWKSAIGRQYSGSETAVNGVSCDLSIFNRKRLNELQSNRERTP